jgi:hypothetical protein
MAAVPEFIHHPEFVADGDVLAVLPVAVTEHVAPTALRTLTR